MAVGEIRWPSGPGTRSARRRAPNSMTSQCTGRTNCASPAPQRIGFAHRQRVERCPHDLGQQVDVSAPGLGPSGTRTTRPWVSRASRARDVDAAAARESPVRPASAAPCASNAALTGGPRRSSVRSGCCSASRRTRTARRRGVAKRATAPCCRPALRQTLRDAVRESAAPASAATSAAAPRCRARPGNRGGQAHARWPVGTRLLASAPFGLLAALMPATSGSPSFSRCA